LLVAVVGGLVVWYAIVEVKIAKTESAVVENKQGITQNKTDIKELEIGQVARSRAVSEFYRDHWPRVGANTKAIEGLGEAVDRNEKDQRREPQASAEDSPKGEVSALAILCYLVAVAWGCLLFSDCMWSGGDF
jgi:hypothetical protein